MQSLAPVPSRRLAEADALRRRGHFVQAIVQLGEIGPDDADAVEALTLQGDCLSEIGARGAALASWRTARKLAPAAAELARRLVCDQADAAGMDGAAKTALLPNFSLPPELNFAARKFLDLACAPYLGSVYANDNMIVFQRALTFLREAPFMEAVGLASEGELTFADRTWRAHVLVWAARNALRLDGDFVELGTFRGFFATCLVHALDFATAAQHLHLYDTFEGLADDSVRENLPETFYDGLQAHYSEPDIHASVLARFADFTNVHVIRGKVPDSLEGTAPERIAWLHVDMNSANHEIAALERLWDRLVPGAHVVLDDYGHCVFRKQTQAHQAFFAARGLPICELPTGQGLVIKSG